MKDIKTPLVDVMIDDRVRVRMWWHWSHDYNDLIIQSTDITNNETIDRQFLYVGTR